MALISSGSMVLLKYKLNNVCDADHRPANGAQRTMIILIYHNILYFLVGEKLIRIISVLNAYYRRIMKTMRIACVLDNLNCKHALITQKEGR